jgi:hypothetical protein
MAAQEEEISFMKSTSMAEPEILAGTRSLPDGIRTED